MRKFVLLLVAVLLVVLAWSGGWLFAASEIRKAVASLGQGADGDTKVTCGRLDVTGFPFRFDIECTEATLVAEDLTIAVAGLKSTLLAYNPTQAKFSALSPATLDDAFSGASNRIDFTAVEGSARLVNDDIWRGLSGEGWRIGRVSLVADGVAWNDTLLAERTLMSAGRLEAHLMDVPERHDETAGTAVLAVFAALADTAAPEYGITAGEASFEAELSGLPDDVRALAAADLGGRWRDAGGQLKLIGLKGNVGEEFIESTGTLSLDSGSRLDGQVSIKSKGLVERFGAALPEDWRGLILGRQADDGSYAQTVTLKAGIVFTGLVPVMMIPPLL